MILLSIGSIIVGQVLHLVACSPCKSPNKSEICSAGCLTILHTETLGSTTPFLLSIERSYNSRLTGGGILGKNWTCLPLDICLCINTDANGKTAAISLDQNQKWTFRAAADDRYTPTGRNDENTLCLLKTDSGFTLRDGDIERMKFDTQGNIVNILDPTSGVWEIGRDDKGFPCRITLSGVSDQALTVTCDHGLRRLKEITSPDGKKWQYEYDAENRLSAVTDSTGFRRTYAYEADRLANAGDSLGNETIYAYDADGRITEINRNGRKETRAYATLPSSRDDCMLTITDALGRKTEHHFLMSAKQEKIVSYDGTTTVRNYDPSVPLYDAMDTQHQTGSCEIRQASYQRLLASLTGKAFLQLPYCEQRFAITDSLISSSPQGQIGGSSANTLKMPNGAIWSCDFDHYGNIVKINEGDSTVATITYDAVDRILSIEYGDSVKETFDYDIADHLVRYTSPQSEIYAYEYDKNGNLLKETLPNGESSEFEYSERGLMVSAFNSFWHDVFGYDLQGRLTLMGRLTPVSSDVETLLSYLYDEKSRLESVLLPDGTECSYGYDDTNHSETVDFLDYRITAVRDKDGKIKILETSSGATVQFGYTENGNLSRIEVTDARSGGKATDYCQYENGKLVKVIAQSGGQRNEFQFDYSRSRHLKSLLKNGIPLTLDQNTGTSSFDALGRLRLLKKGPAIIDYQYDKWGVLGYKTQDDYVWLVRLSDGVPCGFVRNGQPGAFVVSAVPTRAFTITVSEQAIIERFFSDSVQPVLDFEKEFGL